MARGGDHESIDVPRICSCMALQIAAARAQTICEQCVFLIFESHWMELHVDSHCSTSNSRGCTHSCAVAKDFDTQPLYQGFLCPP